MGRGVEWEEVREGSQENPHKAFCCHCHFPLSPPELGREARQEQGCGHRSTACLAVSPADHTANGGVIIKSGVYQGHLRTPAFTQKCRN